MRSACASVLLFFGLVFGQESPSPFQSVPATAPEDTITFVTPLPDFVAKDINGRVWRSGDLRGKTTLIYIWSTYCAPCRREHPELQRFYEKAKTTGNVQVLTFSMDHDSTKARAYMSEKKYTFPVIADWTLIRKLFPPEGALPQAWVIDPRGWRSVPFRSWTLGQVLCNLEKTAPTN
jgi:peroxiredoxin